MAATYGAVNGQAWAKKPYTSGRWPSSQSRANSSAKSLDRIRDSANVDFEESESSILVIIQSQLTKDSFGRARKLHPPGLRLSPQPGGDISPTHSLGAQIGHLPLLGSQQVLKALH